ncbi:hypothetical protein M407DRAFT_19213 [Tulasnella calospora MUT 4182]|uniref:Uncharacterized protein n=1 Tax=Tulasnella calospora MUT 4182 TaxID=1051891 RepID=A0A0C3QS45_9AGAM|nr:hypothetical protein M407DRAFT_19213 [Tulasnella calospora MUT 4182]
MAGRPAERPCPRACFDGVEGIIDSGKIIHNNTENCTLVISTRSDLAYALQLQLPRPGVSTSSANVRLLQSWSGYSKLLDAIHPLWAFARACANQTPMILHSLSGRSVRLDGMEDDELLNLSRAIQIREQDIAVVRSQRLDIYSMDSVMSTLNYGSSDVTSGAVKPVQTLAYPYAWTGSCPRFIPTRPPWLRPQPSREGDIYLSLIEDDLRFYVGLVAHRGAAVAAGGITYEFEEPYELFGPRSHWTTAISWGESARRVVGVSIPSDGDPLEECGNNMERVVVRWQILHGDSNFTRYLTFDKSTGVSVIAMASGHIWIADPTTTSVELVAPFNPVSLVCPDPAWPSSHPTPWLRGITRNRILDEDQEDRPTWTSSVENFFPDKNRPDCFGGATWFVNEVLHIRGTAEVFLLPSLDFSQILI